jgi:hypothetical protein
MTNNFKHVDINTKIYNGNAVVVEFTYRDVIYTNGVELSEVIRANMIPQTFVFKRLVEPFVHVSGIKYTMDQLHEFNTVVCNKVAAIASFPKEV